MAEASSGTEAGSATGDVSPAARIGRRWLERAAAVA